MKMQNKVQGRLGYNAENELYGLLVFDRHTILWRFGICAGKSLRKETVYGENLPQG